MQVNEYDFSMTDQDKKHMKFCRFCYDACQLVSKFGNVVYPSRDFTLPRV